MRLTCPNCGAQYEVPDEVIPRAGRDVQCSNCGTTWFQAHPDAIEEETAPPPPVAPEPAPAPQPSTAPAAPAQTVDTPPEAPMPQVQKAVPQPRRQLPADVADVLREEAERESRQRKASVESLETQTEMGLDEPIDESTRRAREAEARMNRLQGLPETGHGADLDPTSRRNLLPDIEEINTSLGGTQNRAQTDARYEAPPAPSGFRSGFRLMAVVTVIAVAIYALTPKITEFFPGLSGPLGTYVRTVNEGRVWLAERVAELQSQVGGG